MLKSIAAVDLRESSQQKDMLGPDLQWAIIQDRGTLAAGASKDADRQIFLERVVERDGDDVPADNPGVVTTCPRCRCCIYVASACPGTIRGKVDQHLSA